MVEDIVRSFGYLTLGTRLKRLGERLQAETHVVLDAAGSTAGASQSPFLGAIDHLGPLTIGELAEAIGISQPGVTRSVAALIERGLLQAEISPDDQRRRIIALSPQGRALVDMMKRETWPAIEAAVTALCDGTAGSLLDRLAAIEDRLDDASIARRIKEKETPR